MLNVLTRYDKILLIFFFLLALMSLAGSVYATRFVASGIKELVITKQNEVVFRQRIDNFQGTRFIAIKGPLGVTRFELYKDKVRVISSPCLKKICIKQGWVSKPNQSIVCAPNRIVATIEAKADSGIDAFIR
jgi:hypothetical protein